MIWDQFCNFTTWFEELPAKVAWGSYFVPMFESDDDLVRTVDAIDRAGGIIVPPNHVVMGLAAYSQPRILSAHRTRFLWIASFL